MTRRLNRAVFISKNSTKFVIGGIVSAFLLIFGGMYISDMRTKPTTAGMSPHEVTEGLYTSVSNLNANMLTVYSASKAAKEYINLVSAVFMTNNIRGKYEGSPLLATPERLFEEELDHSHTVYGITQLEIEETHAGPDTVEQLVSFYLFLPEETSVTDAGEKLWRDHEPLSVYYYRDRCTLTLKKDRWKITSIEPLERSLVENSGEVIFNAVASGNGGTLPYAP